VKEEAKDIYVKGKISISIWERSNSSKWQPQNICCDRFNKSLKILKG